MCKLFWMNLINHSNLQYVRFKAEIIILFTSRYIVSRLINNINSICLYNSWNSETIWKYAKKITRILFENLITWIGVRNRSYLVIIWCIQLYLCQQITFFFHLEGFYSLNVWNVMGISERKIKKMLHSQQLLQQICFVQIKIYTRMLVHNELGLLTENSYQTYINFWW